MKNTKNIFHNLSTDCQNYVTPNNGRWCSLAGEHAGTSALSCGLSLCLGSLSDSSGAKVYYCHMQGDSQ